MSGRTPSPATGRHISVSSLAGHSSVSTLPSHHSSVSTLPRGGIGSARASVMSLSTVNTPGSARASVMSLGVPNHATSIISATSSFASGIHSNTCQFVCICKKRI